MTSAFQRIAVVGAGAWGTALAIAAFRSGRDVTLWAREPEVLSAIRESGENTHFLPGVSLDPSIKATDDLADAASADAVLLVAPAQYLRAVAGDLAPYLAAGTPLVICAKGIEIGTRALMNEVLAKVLPDHPQAVLSGPTFAREVADGRPTAVTLAAAEPALAQSLCAALASRSFRPYAGGDPVGALIGGAVKNVIAIACGIVGGCDLGQNARAALITRGLSEMARLGEAKGAQVTTFSGLSGLGDLTLTCTSMASRNYALGHAIGSGHEKASVLEICPSVTEGAYTAEAVTGLAAELGVEMPICRAVDAVLNREGDIDATIGDLLDRPLRTEMAGV